MRLNVAVSGFGQLDLWRIAGKGPYEQGEQFVDAVADLQPTTDGVRATVHDSEPYQVSLGWADGQLTGDCSCPYGREGTFCKHCVAVGLSWIDDAELGPPSAEELREYLTSLDHDRLVDLLCEHAEDDETLYRRLSLLAAGDRAVPDAAAS